MNQKDREDPQPTHGQGPSDGKGRPENHGAPEDHGRPVIPHRSSAQTKATFTQDR